MILYHGSNVILDKPRLIDQNRTLDFGYISGSFISRRGKMSEVSIKTMLEFMIPRLLWTIMEKQNLTENEALD